MDRRITRSRKALRDAFVELVETEGLEGFSVNDLCSRADLNRGTFYNHYRGKDEFLEVLEDEIMGDFAVFRERVSGLTLIDLAKLKVSKGQLPVLVELFDYLREQGRLINALLGPQGDARFGQRLRDTLCTDLIMGLLHERYREHPTPFVKYYVAFYSSAYLGIITHWLEGGMKESSEEMARIATRLLFIKPGESIEL